MRNSLKNRIMNYLMEKSGRWLFTGQIDDSMRNAYGNIGGTVERRLRELKNENRIESAQAIIEDGQFKLVEKGGSRVWRYKVIEPVRVEESKEIELSRQLNLI